MESPVRCLPPDMPENGNPYLRNGNAGKRPLRID